MRGMSNRAEVQRCTSWSGLVLGAAMLGLYGTAQTSFLWFAQQLEGSGILPEWT